MSSAVQPTSQPVVISVPLLGGDFAALQAGGAHNQPAPQSPLARAQELVNERLFRWTATLAIVQRGGESMDPVVLPAPYPMPEDRPWLAIDLTLRPEQLACVAMVAQSTDPTRLGEVLGGLIRDGVANMRRAMVEIGRAV